MQTKKYGYKIVQFDCKCNVHKSIVKSLYQVEYSTKYWTTGSDLFSKSLLFLMKDLEDVENYFQFLRDFETLISYSFNYDYKAKDLEIWKCEVAGVYPSTERLFVQKNNWQEFWHEYEKNHLMLILDNQEFPSIYGKFIECCHTMLVEQVKLYEKIIL